MGENSAIEWTDHTFNPWVGCTRISPACDHCYAENWAKRTGQAELWAGKRRRTSEVNWRQPLKWNRDAAAAGVRRRVFCASVADVFDNQVPDEWRDDLWTLIAGTRHLDWLLLTKRPQNIAKMLPVIDSHSPRYKPWNEKWPWRNVWLGTTVENQDEADRRIPHLLAVPAAVRFLSCEPLLGPVDISEWLFAGDPPCAECPKDIDCECGWRGRAVVGRSDALHWVITGGESGPGARPMLPEWATNLRDQCGAAGVAFHFKQWGEWAPGENASSPMVRAEQTATWWNDEWSFDRVTPSQAQDGHVDDEPDLYRLGKKRAGRHLDGVLHDAFPTVAA